jgi:hypothetical protein
LTWHIAWKKSLAIWLLCSETIKRMVSNEASGSRKFSSW